MRRAASFTLLAASLLACGGSDDSAGSSSAGGAGGSSAAGTGGSSSAGSGGSATAGSSSAGSAGAAGGLVGDPSGTYGLTVNKSFDSCTDLAPLDPTPGATLTLTVEGTKVTATFTGWPADQITALSGTATLTGTLEGDQMMLQAPPSAPMTVNGCMTQWMVAASGTLDGKAVTGALVFSRGASTSTACTDQGIKPCPRAVNFFGTKG